MGGGGVGVRRRKVMGVVERVKVLRVMYTLRVCGVVFFVLWREELEMKERERERCVCARDFSRFWEDMYVHVGRRIEC